jgi:hypothetical protein
LGQKGLSVNPSKTLFSGDDKSIVDKKVDSIKKGLLRRKAYPVVPAGQDLVRPVSSGVSATIAELLIQRTI